MARLEPLWLHLDAISARLARSRTLCVGSDFDGTLTPIVAHPSAAALAPRARRALERLVALRGARVALISGRALADLRRQVRVDGAWLAGSSGLVTTGASGRARIEVPVAKRVPAALLDSLRAWCARVPGSWIEDKQVAYAIHYRAVPAARQPSFAAGVRRRVRPFASRARLVAGKKVFELVPAVARDKSHALDRWLPRGAARAALFYFGDDTNDEPLHGRVRRLGGIAVAVGRVRSRAEYVVPGPDHVVWMLEWLAREWAHHRGLGVR